VCSALAACAQVEQEVFPDYRSSAEGFFRGVFACEPGGIERFAADTVILSYPIFETRFGTPSIRGRDGVRQFSSGFCQRWSDPVLTVYDAIQEGNRVVLVWGFEALSTQAPETEPAGTRTGWGGISYFRFTDDGRVALEVGEESTPGPIARVPEALRLPLPP